MQARRALTDTQANADETLTTAAAEQDEKLQHTQVALSLAPGEFHNKPLPLRHSGFGGRGPEERDGPIAKSPALVVLHTRSPSQLSGNKLLCQPCAKEAPRGKALGPHAVSGYN